MQQRTKEMQGPALLVCGFHQCAINCSEQGLHIACASTHAWIFAVLEQPQDPLVAGSFVHDRLQNTQKS